MLDVKDGFFNVPLREDLIPYFCFAIGNQEYQFTRLVQGFGGSACLFHAILARILSGLPVIQYMDDILIGGDNTYQHNQVLNQVFARLEKFGFKLKKHKLQIMQDQVEFLGHQVSENRVSLAGYREKLKEKIPKIQGRKSLQQGIGMLNVLKPNIPHFAQQVKSLYEIVGKKGRQENWDQVNTDFQQIL